MADLIHSKGQINLHYSRHATAKRSLQIKFWKLYIDQVLGQAKNVDRSNQTVEHSNLSVLLGRLSSFTELVLFQEIPHAKYQNLGLTKTDN